MHAYRPQQGPQRTRVLYLFRSPSHIRMGRQPLDEEIREALEHTHPDVSFDWSALSRESVSVRSDEGRDRDRSHRQERHERHERNERRSGGGAARAPQPPAPIPVLVDDQSLLGRTLGAERAADLRTQYGELLQRIARRSRTPEDRDRLTQRAQRLNPDEWPDEAGIRAHADTVRAEWEALAGELPSRRRGRRGGRRRDRPDEGGDHSSAIMDDGGESDRDVERAPMDGPDGAAGDRRDDRGAGAEPVEPAGDRLPGDD